MVPRLIFEARILYNWNLSSPGDESQTNLRIKSHRGIIPQENLLQLLWLYCDEGRALVNTIAGNHFFLLPNGRLEDIFFQWIINSVHAVPLSSHSLRNVCVCVCSILNEYGVALYIHKHSKTNLICCCKLWVFRDKKSQQPTRRLVWLVKWLFLISHRGLLYSAHHHCCLYCE